jgi:hypothetical protein
VRRWHGKAYQKAEVLLAVRCQPGSLDRAPRSGTMAAACGINSAVECQLPKLKVAGSNPVSRSKSLGYLGTLYPPARTTHRFPTNRIRAGDAVEETAVTRPEGVRGGELGRGWPSPPDRPPPLAGVPWDIAQDAMRPEAVVILAGVARVLAIHAQDERRQQVPDPAGKSGGVGGGSGARRDGGRDRAQAA